MVIINVISCQCAAMSIKPACVYCDCTIEHNMIHGHELTLIDVHMYNHAISMHACIPTCASSIVHRINADLASACHGCISNIKSIWNKMAADPGQ